MNGEGNPLLTLAATFGLMSLFAVGGTNSAVPEMHRVAIGAAVAASLTRLNPLWLLLAGGILGFAGVI